VKDLEEIKSQYDLRMCRLDPKMEEELQKEVKAIQQINTFDKYFKRMGFPPIKMSKLNEILKQAVRNSAEKGYHGAKKEAADTRVSKQ